MAFFSNFLFFFFVCRDYKSPTIYQ
uniref:Uncharacterized protein n=1 Tax=Rhizophora mucronata TaxID=61149 RepID=A0A2P2R1S2_RHIMU